MQRNDAWIAERFVLAGRVGWPGFPGWIARHGARLGLSLSAPVLAGGALTLDAAGPPELLDALEVGCLLGPYEVWVDRIDRFPSG